jgi:hypothetical protein
MQKGFARTGYFFVDGKGIIGENSSTPDTANGWRGMAC